MPPPDWLVDAIMTNPRGWRWHCRIVGAVVGWNFVTFIAGAYQSDAMGATISASAVILVLHMHIKMRRARRALLRELRQGWGLPPEDKS
jgi:hypothetical protein